MLQEMKLSIFVLSLISFVLLFYVLKSTHLTKGQKARYQEALWDRFLPGRLSVENSQPPLHDSADDWKNITNEQETLFVYSAFYDDFDSSQPLIRVIGLRKLNKTEASSSVFCVFSHRREVKDAGKVLARSVVIPDHHFTRYVAVQLLCPLPRPELRPSSVHLALSTSDLALPSSDLDLVGLRVVYPDLSANRTMTLCFPALFNFDDSRHLVEMLELSRLMGADHVMLYDHSVAPQVRDVMHYYVRKGFLRVFKWQCPAVDVHNYAQLAVVNDCLYRNFRSSHYVMMNDIDEVIVPSKGRTWTQWVKEVKLNESQVGAALFRMTFFDQEMEGGLTREDRELARGLALETLLHTGRENYTYPRNRRTKPLVLPMRVEMAGIHWPHQYRHGVRGVLRADPEDAVVHHYRKRLGNVRKGSTRLNTDLLFLAPALIRNVQRVWDDLEDVVKSNDLMDVVSVML